MHKINGNAFVDLDSFLDIKSLESMHNDIVLGIAKSEEYIAPSFTTQSTLLNKTQTSFFDSRRHAEKIFVEDNKLTQAQLNWYAKLNTSVTLGHHLLLRDNKGYPYTYKYKHLNKFSIDMPCCSNFQFLFDWIYEQQCFEEYGRVLFWLAEPNQRSAIHTDYGDYNSNRRDMFIWITGINPKKLIIMDPETGIEERSSSKTCIFDSNNWHYGMGHPDYASWSLRVDGIFNPDWARRVGISEYFGIK